MGKHCHCAFSRRQFLQMTGGALACSALQPLAARAAAARAAAAGINTTTPIFPKSRARVGLVFSHVPTGHATWPTKDYDYGKRAAELTASLKKLCPRVDFDIHTAHNAAEADAIIAATGDVDGYLVYAIGIWTRVPDRVMRSGKPVVLADDLFAGSGEVLISSGVARREKLPVVVVSSSSGSGGGGGAAVVGVVVGWPSGEGAGVAGIGLKWPNDLLVGSKKICGILTELSAEMERINYLVAGIGINVNQDETDFPEELRESAASLKNESKRKIDRVRLIQTTLAEFEGWYGTWLEQGFAPVLARWKEMSVSLNCPVRISTPNNSWDGWAEDIDSDGALLLRLPGGELRRVI